MKTIKTAILMEHNLGKALRLLRDYVTRNAAVVQDSRLEDIQSDYERMCDFMLRGYKDQQQSEVYKQLLYRLFSVCCDMEMDERSQSGAGYSAFAVARSHSLHFMDSLDMIRQKLEEFVQNVALTSLGADEATKQQKLAELYAGHLQYVAMLFDRLLVSYQWNEGEQTFYTKLLVSPTIDANDAQLLLSALMMATMNNFDPRKWLTLVSVYEQVGDEHLRQRAFVGWMLSLPKIPLYLFPLVHQKIEHLCADEKVKREMLELQMQMEYCNGADADTEEIQRNIMPSLLKGNNIQFTNTGIIEKDEDLMKNILDPSAADKAMEEAEESFNRMQNMQKAGSDIYFGGFSQMKRFPFFHQIVNWFCPFYQEHPDIREVVREFSDYQIFQILFDKGPFCDSDKYSFVLALSSVMNKIPANMREMLNNADALGATSTEEEQQSPSYIRHMYLQDLYRFFRLYQQHADFDNPFDFYNYPALLPFANKNMTQEGLIEQVVSLCKFLYKRHHYSLVEEILTRYEPCLSDEGLLLSATIHLRTGEYSLACTEFELLLQSGNVQRRAISGYAQACFYLQRYDESQKYYQQLYDLQPDNQDVELNLVVSQINNHRIEDAMQHLFKLNYEHADDERILRVLAWAYMVQDKLKEADAIYRRLVNGEHAQSNDFLNAGYCKWLCSDIVEAIDLFRKYESKKPGLGESRPTLEQQFASDAKFLTSKKISDTERCIMLDLVARQ
jgi:tetratricopeptide (TPR) repeat protein